MLFSIYDVDGSGTIDYKEFTSLVFGGAPAQGGSKQGGGSNPEALAQKLQEKLASRGARGIIGL